jgi:hypothetical protein
MIGRKSDSTFQCGANLAAPQGFEPRYADPELMDHTGENPGFDADNSITYHQLKPARKHFDEVLKRLGLARSESKRMAHLRHTMEEMEFGHEPRGSEH